MKHIVFFLTAFCAAWFATADVGVSNVVVTVQQNEGIAEITYEVVADDPDTDVWVMFEGWDRDRGLAIFPRTLSGDATTGSVKPGVHTTFWHVATDRPGFHSSAFAIKATAVKGLAPYRVLDLSGGVSADAFQVTDAATGPSFADDSQYTTNLWMRLVLPGTFMIGSPSNELGRVEMWGREIQHQVTLTKPYYIGVIETTRKHWALVTGTPVVSTSDLRKEETEETLRLPEDDVSYDMIRGATQGAGWPANHNVDADSFLGMLRAKTDRLYDLPTDAQWEYACRAGTTTALNSGKEITSTNQCPNAAEVGRYLGNRNDGLYLNHYCALGGNYQPNNWGLYDMNGNTAEWCLDWIRVYPTYAEVDPKGVSSGSQRVLRGFNYSSNASRLRSASRTAESSNYSYGRAFGFRLAEHLNDTDGFAFSSSLSPDFSLELRDMSEIDASIGECSVAEAGWLTENTVWSNDVIHVVRDWVTVPSGVTLTIIPGTTVRFCEDSGILVKSDGTLSACGIDTNQINFVPFAEGGTWTVSVENGGQVDANEFTGVEGLTKGKTADIRIDSGCGSVMVPCDFTTPDGCAAEISWRTVEGTAKTGVDFTETVGCSTQEWPHTMFIAEVPIILSSEMRPEREFEVEFRLKVSGFVTTWRTKITISDTPLVKRNEIAMGDVVESEGCFIDTYSIGETIVLDQVLPITYDTSWDGSSVGVKVTATTPSGTTSTVVEKQGSSFGDMTWTPTAGSGCYTFTHETAGGVLTARIAVLEEGYIRIGSRRLTETETWSADKVYVIDGEFIVADGGRLVIPAGTVVKFTSGSRLSMVNGGVCEAAGVTFTHVNDDAVGGDTLNDGDATMPMAGQYDIVGNIRGNSATSYRYRGLICVQGEIKADTIWNAGQVYFVINNVVVSNGVTLTIAPGAIVKIADSRYIYARPEGVIEAIGTRAQPIVFTSEHDDTYGGDTNGDGDRTFPQPGDWQRIDNRGGTMRFKNCKFLYGSKGGMGGTLLARIGQITVVDSEISHSAFDAIGVEKGGDAFITNCVIRDALAAFRHYNTNEIVNCVVYDCGRITQGGNHKFRNCVFSEITDVWQSGQQPNNFRNCCFWNKGGMELIGDVAWQTTNTTIVTQSASVYLNKNGNVWGDPLFADPMNGDFRIQEGSACVDAADGAVSPDTDLYGQPRVTLFADPSGMATAAGCVPDIGVSELMPRNMSADIDFEARRVVAAGPVAPGDEITVKWTIGNLGGRDVDESWRDTISLVSANGRTVTLGEKVSSARIPAGGSAVCSATFTVPVLAEGSWYPKVQVNTYRDVFEGSLTDNNALTGTDPVEVVIDAADMSATLSGRIVAGVPTVLKLPFTEDTTNRLVRMALPEGVSASWGFGFMPQGMVSSGTTVASGNDICFLAPDGEQTVYVVLESNASADYSFAFENNPLVISSISPTSIPKSGMTSITITGAGFTQSNTVSFASASGTVAPESVRYVNANTLVATVDCGKFTSGATYTAETSVDVLVSSLANALSVTDEEGKGELDITWVIPGSVRIGRVFSFPITVQNIGTADLGCPMISVSDSVTTNDYPIEFSLDGEVFTPGGIQFISKDADGGFDGLKVGDTAISFVYARVPAGNPGASAISIYANTENDDMAEFTTEVDKYLTPDMIEEYETTTNEEVKVSITNLKNLCGTNNGEFVQNFAELARKFYACNGLVLQRIDSLLPYGLRLQEDSSSDSEETTQSEQNASHYTLEMNLQSTRPVQLMSTHAQDLADQARRNLNLHITTGAYLRRDGGYAKLEDVDVDLSNKSVLIIAHGLNDGINSSWMKNIASALASKYDEVIYVNWQAEAHANYLEGAAKYAFFWNWNAADLARLLGDKYIQILEVSGRIGAVVTLVQSQLMVRNFNSPKKCVCIGHSFGSHLTGVLSRRLGKVKRHIGLDTAAISVVPPNYQVKGDDAEITEYYRTSSGSGRNDPYANYNYIVCKVGGFDAVETADVDVFFGPHSYAHEWFVQNLRSGQLSGIGYWSNGKPPKYFEGHSGYLGVICGHNLQSFECVYPFEDKTQYPVTTAIHYPGFQNGWLNMRDAWQKTVDLSVNVSGVREDMTMYTGEDNKVHISVTDNSDIRSASFSKNSYGTNKKYNMQVLIRNLRDDRWDELESQTKTSPDFDFTLKIPHGYGDAEKILRNRICFKLDCVMRNNTSVYPISYTDLYSADNERTFTVKIKKAHNPIASINSKKHSGFVLKKKIHYSSRKKFNEACSKGKTFEFDFRANASEAGEKRKISSYAWRDSYSWLWGWGSVVSKKEHFEKKYSATSNGLYPIMLTVTDDEGFSSSIDGHLQVIIDVKPDGNPVKNPKSKDPNEMAGPMGTGNPETQRFLEPGQRVSYTVYYENATNATAAAQEVFVTNSLSQYLDWSTFEMGEVVFGDQIDLGLAGKQCATNEVTMTGTNLIVRTIVELDKEKGEVRWYQRVIDPDSGDTWPADVTGGFLPPNNPETHCGEGHLTYFIKVRADAPRGVRIDNSADIVFDTNEAIKTKPAWWNCIATHQDVAMTVDGVETNLDLIVGLPFGELPVPAAMEGWSFAGWFTGPDGTGVRVTAESIVPEGLTRLYEFWTQDAPALVVGGRFDPAYAKADAVMSALYDNSSNLLGVVQIKAGKKSKKGLVKFTATATLSEGGKSKKVSAKAVSINVDALAKSGADGVEAPLVFKAPLGGMTFLLLPSGEFALFGAAGFASEADVGGNLPGGTMVFRAAFDPLPTLDDGFAVIEEALPERVDVQVSGGKKLNAGRAAAVKYAKDKASGAVKLTGLDDPAKPNLSGLKLSYTPKSGVMKGSFKVYSSNAGSVQPGSVPKLKKHSANVVGFVLDEGEGKTGRGEATVKKPAAGPWKVRIEN